MKPRQTTYPLRLPGSIKSAVEEYARADGISLNQFVTIAVAEKLSAMKTAEYFAERRSKADLAAFDRFMNRKTGEPTPPEDRLDDDMIDGTHPIE